MVVYRHDICSLVTTVMGAWTSSQHHGLLERPFEPGAEIGGDRNRSRGGVIVSHLDALRFRDELARSGVHDFVLDREARPADRVDLQPHDQAIGRHRRLAIVDLDPRDDEAVGGEGVRTEYATP